ncbi:LLM class F420-dependent oxidoreductase [Actinoallomurus bryophytorum]|uniref:F420-dependent oxidoreductase-like protein n=1 Tax=Actinoallomurus bryophytorum TaxID=1490222 RepID=A0A543CS15_9ACTN|nr:LLM class F420-dependent oxidoreductase [Actinoallomurus bryophytorum]TQL99874.1 F420-dependent oxidoreductase-like protein [Actinoallomurus bryophytorum]
MLLRIFTEPQQGADYTTLLRVAKATEDGGFDAFFRSDHYLKMGDVSGLPGPSDAWVTLAGLARETERIRLGTLVTAATFRLPGPLAISVANVDDMSGGRVELGLGTGWYDEEHTAYGIPFPGLGERFDRLEEQLEIITGMWDTPSGKTFDFEGAHYQVTGSPALPKPAQRPRPPIIIGGVGAKRTPRLAARFADEFNVPFHSIEETRAAYERVRAACENGGRDDSSITFSAAQVICCGRDDAQLRQRADAIGRSVEDLRENGIAGTPAEVVARLAAFGEAGAERAYLQVLDLNDLDHLALLASDVLPQV